MVGCDKDECTYESCGNTIDEGDVVGETVQIFDCKGVESTALVLDCIGQSTYSLEGLGANTADIDWVRKSASSQWILKIGKLAAQTPFHGKCPRTRNGVENDHSLPSLNLPRNLSHPLSLPLSSPSPLSLILSPRAPHKIKN